MVFGTFTEDRQYLIGKFRHPVYPEQPGLENSMLSQRAEKLENAALGKPAEEVKAELFEFVCDNMLIDVNPQDFFVAFGCWRRDAKPLSKALGNRENRLYQTVLKQEQIKMDLGRQTGTKTLWFDTDHSIPDWDFLLAEGFPGAVSRIEAYRELHRQQGTLDADRERFFTCVLRAYRKMVSTLARFREFGYRRYPGNERVAMVCESLRRLENGAPRNFFDALQFIYLYFMFSEYIDRFQVRSLGNLDVILLPFYQRSLASGEFSENEMRELLAYFFMQWGSIDNYWGQPFYMAGTNSDGSSRVNQLSYIILEEYDKLDIPTPKIQIKVNENTPKDFLSLAFDMIRQGHSSIVFINEKAIERAMLVLGRSPAEAADPDITGCYEWGAKANENITQSIHCNLLKMVELALNDGFDPATGRDCGLRTGKAEDLRSYSDFYEAFLLQLSWHIEEIIAINDRLESYLTTLSPALVLSGALENPLKVGRDGFALGCKYNSSMMLLVGFATMVDSLLAVKKLVFEQCQVTLSELREICRNNWQGHEDLRNRALHLPEKFGGGSEEADQLARNLAGFLSNKINLHPNCRGGYYMASSHPALQFVLMGARTGATPDGRLAGEEMSKNISPSVGMDRNGVTALIHSVTSVDSSLLPGNFTLDVMLHPETVRGGDGLRTMLSLMQVYFKRGGNAIQFNIFSPDLLREAQRDPERYRNLQVRICGWNARFLDMNVQEQDCYIKRSENISE